MKYIFFFLLVFVSSINPQSASAGERTLSYGEWWNTFGRARASVLQGFSCTQIANRVMEVQKDFARLSQRDREKAHDLISKLLWSSENFKSCMGLDVHASPEEAGQRFNVYERNTLDISISNGDCSSTIQIENGLDITSVYVHCYPESSKWERRQCNFSYNPRSGEGHFSIAQYYGLPATNNPLFESPSSIRAQANSASQPVEAPISMKRLTDHIQSVMSEKCNEDFENYERPTRYSETRFETEGYDCWYRTLSTEKDGDFNRSLDCYPNDMTDHGRSQCNVSQRFYNGEITSFEVNLYSYRTPVQLIGENSNLDVADTSEKSFLEMARNWLDINCKSGSGPKFRKNPAPTINANE